MYCPKLNLKLFKTIVFVAVTGFLTFSSKSYAAEIYINPATGNIESTSFQATITVDPSANTDIREAFVYIKYDPQILTLNSINNGSFETYIQTNNNQSTGVVTIQAQNNTDISTITTLATLNFTVNTSSGFADLQILNTTEQPSKLTDVNANNVLNSTTTATYLVNIPQNNTNNYNQNNTNNFTNESTISVPVTGYANNNFLILSSIIAVVLGGIYIRKYAYSKS